MKQAAKSAQITSSIDFSENIRERRNLFAGFPQTHKEALKVDPRFLKHSPRSRDIAWPSERIRCSQPHRPHTSPCPHPSPRPCKMKANAPARP